MHRVFQPVTIQHHRLYSISVQSGPIFTNCSSVIFLIIHLIMLVHVINHRLEATLSFEYLTHEAKLEAWIQDMRYCINSIDVQEVLIATAKFAPLCG